MLDIVIMFFNHFEAEVPALRVVLLLRLVRQILMMFVSLLIELVRPRAEPRVLDLRIAVRHVAVAPAHRVLHSTSSGS